MFGGAKFGESGKSSLSELPTIQIAINDHLADIVNYKTFLPNLYQSTFAKHSPAIQYVKIVTFYLLGWS